MSSDGRSIFISAPAKINLFLKVLGKRPDGYHDIFSWFQAIDLADHLEIEQTADVQITIATNSPAVPTGPENLVYQAAQLIQERRGKPTGFRIKIWKNIPVAAGLGGGSSDAAAFIKGVDKLLGLGLNRPEMAALGLKLGSDLPFFFSRGQAAVSGRGERVQNIDLPIDYLVFLVTPPFPIRASEAYGKVRIDLTEPVAPISLYNCRQAQELFVVISTMANDLEPALLESYPILDKIGKMLEKTGASIVRLTGSGPTIFALYGDRTTRADNLAHAIGGKGWGLNVARPVILPA